MPRVQQKRGTAANLASVNPTPLAGELVWDSTENAIKIGDGTTAWTSLAYVTATPRTHTHAMADLSDVTITSAGSPPAPYDVALTYNYSTSSWVAKAIGLVGVGSQPLGGWPAGSVGASLAGKVDGNDARLSDARTPTAHKATHATGGSDALTPGDIGAAPAASPTFTGVITVAATSGSAGSYLPSVTFSGDANTGFGQVSGQSDTASVFTAGRERVRVDSSGRVGIGNTSMASFNPSFDDLVVGSGGAQSGVTLFSTTQGSLIFGDTATTGVDGYAGYVSYLHSANAMILGTVAAERVRIDSSGRVGVATNTPTATLDINSDTIRVRTARTPASATAAGNAGDICWDASYLYICTATNTWRRIAHSTW